MSTGPEEGEPTLRRELGVVSLTLYGVGVIVGAGIYVLVGKVAGRVGTGAPVAFVVAALAALPTGLAYAELASRYPRSGGEAVYVDRAFGRAGVSFAVGFLVLASGVASTAAVSRGFAHYLRDLVGIGGGADPFVVLAFLATLSWLNHRGIRESIRVNAVLTVASVLALVVLVSAGAPAWSRVDPLRFEGLDGSGAVTAVLGAAALAFYAFVGFEDMCNVAEEVIRPERTIPVAILVAVAIVTLLYAAVGWTVVAVATPDELAASPVPLVLVSERVLPGVPTAWLSVVALLAVANTALVNLVMASRILYGMARQGWIPRAFGRVHRHRRTPTWGVVTSFVLAATFALTGVLEVLAEATNTVLLVVFFAVNLALVVVRVRGVAPDDPGQAVFRVPLVVPCIGMVVTMAFVTRFSPGAYARAAALVGLGVAFHLAVLAGRRRRTRSEGVE